MTKQEFKDEFHGTNVVLRDPNWHQRQNKLLTTKALEYILQDYAEHNWHCWTEKFIKCTKTELSNRMDSIILEE